MNKYTARILIAALLCLGFAARSNAGDVPLLWQNSGGNTTAGITFVQGNQNPGALYADGLGHFGVASGTGASPGTVSSVSVTTANGVSGSVATATTTPAITLTLGAITPTSVATGAITTTSSVLSSSPSAGVGYTTGSGGTVTQITSRATGVTLNTICGTITGNNTSLAGQANAVFTVTDSSVAAQDVVVLCGQSGTTAGTTYKVSTVAAGSFNITEFNGTTSTADTGTPVLQFAVIKASAN